MWILWLGTWVGGVFPCPGFIGIVYLITSSGMCFALEDSASARPWTGVPGWDEPGWI
jgi:hypothetical protein